MLEKTKANCWNQIFPMGLQTNDRNTAGTSLEQVTGTSPEQSLVHKTHLDVGFSKGCQGGHLLVPTDGESNDPYACGDASPEAHVDHGDAQLGPFPTSTWIAIPLDNECQGERPINHAAQRGLARNVAKLSCPWPSDTCGLWVGCAHWGFQLKRGQQLLPALLESPLGTDGARKRQPCSRCVLQPLEGIHL